jgi:hypothetical protein
MLSLAAFFATHISALLFLVFAAGLLGAPLSLPSFFGGAAIALLALQKDWSRAANFGLLILGLGAILPDPPMLFLELALTLFAADLLIDARFAWRWWALLAFTVPALTLVPAVKGSTHGYAVPLLGTCIALLALSRPAAHPWLPSGALALQAFSYAAVSYSLHPSWLYPALFLFLFGLLESAPKPVIRELDVGDVQTLRIAHLSDVHYPTRNEDAAADLVGKLAELKPHLLLITGDLLNSPHAGWAAMTEWLHTLRNRTQLDASRLLLLAGNHDLFLTGLTGLGPVSQVLFRSRLDLVSQDGVIDAIVYCPRQQTAILLLDLNPITAVFSAEGKVYPFRLARLARLLQSDQRLRHATKVLAVHHHVLPVPHQGADFLLSTRGVHHLQRFCAEHKIGLVLHGHKHFATWSHLRIGGATAFPHFVEVLGAGSAFHASSKDSRGHNFNLITSSASGARHIRQFFRPDGAAGFSEAVPAAFEQSLSEFLLRRHTASTHSDAIRWALDIDKEGNSDSTYTVDAIVSNRETPPYQMRLPATEAFSGTPSPYFPTPACAPGALESLRRWREYEDWIYTFHSRPVPDPPSRLELRSHEHAYFILDTAHARESTFPNRWMGATFRDFLYFDLSDSTARLELILNFPNGVRIANPSLRACEAGDRLLNELQSQRIAGCLHFDPAVDPPALSVSIASPSPNFRYFLEWDVTLTPDPGDYNRRTARQREFEARLLTYAASPGPDLLSLALAHFADAVGSSIASAIGAPSSSLVSSGIDASLMVRRQDPKPALVVVRGANLKRRDFSFHPGQGNAGAAYRGRAIRSFDPEAANSNPAAHVYARIPGGNEHKYLISVPVIDPLSALPVAVLSIGALTTHAAAQLRATAPTAVREKIVLAVQSRVYPLLLEAVNMKVESAA